MSDFEPKDGWKNMLCVEAGSVGGLMKLDAADAWEGSVTVKLVEEG
jgi:glucose-6-phosphate 1-epimerase